MSFTGKKGFWKMNYSYGVFLYARSTQQFLLIQNRDSHAFLFFFMIRRIEEWTLPQLIRLLEECTHDEIQRLLYYPFDEIYNDLYLNHDPVRFVKQETTARHNYDYFHGMADLKEAARSIRGSPIMWEFPKGRLSDPSESPIDCAFRELTEESGVQISCPGPRITREECVMYRATHYVKYKPYMGQRVMVELYGAVVDHPIPLIYRWFTRRLRPRSLSDECLHGRWVSWDEARTMISTDMAEVIEPLWREIRERGVPPHFIACR